MTSLSRISEETGKLSDSEKMLLELLAQKLEAGTASPDEMKKFESLLARTEAAPPARTPVTGVPVKASAKSELREAVTSLGTKLKSGTATESERKELDALLARLEAVAGEEEKLKTKSATTAKIEAAKTELATREARLASKIREREIKSMMDSLKDLDRVSLCFLLDATSSMGRYIEEAKNKTTLIVKELLASNPLLTLDVAVVAYRDPLEGPAGGDNVSMDFVATTKEGQFTSTGIRDFEKFLDTVPASGGEDACEDIAGGLKLVLGLRWDEHTPTRVLFHIADAPCHGAAFHADNVGDNHSHGDHGIINLLQQVKLMKIHYYFGKLTPYTDIMIDKFNSAVPSLEAGTDFVQVAPLSAPSALTKVVTTKVRESMTLSKKIADSKLLAHRRLTSKPGADMGLGEIDAILSHRSATSCH